MNCGYLRAHVNFDRDLLSEPRSCCAAFAYLGYCNGDFPERGGNLPRDTLIATLKSRVGADQQRAVVATISRFYQR